MKKLYTLFALFFSLITFQAYSQCSNDNVLVSGSLTPPGVSLSTTQTFAAGQYMLCYVTAGSNYTISTCGGSSWDTQITVYNDATGAFIVYNDDFCGLQSTVTFTSTFCGYVRVLLDQFFCNPSGLTTNVTCTLNSGSPTGVVLASSPDASGCPNNTVSLGQSNPASGGTPPYTYAWSPPTNLSSTNTATTTATVNASNTYTLTVTDVNGCSDTDIVVLTQLPPPAVNLGPDTTLCGGPLVIDAGNPGSSYLWSTGAGTQTITVTQSGTYSVTVQTPLGCLGGDNIVVTINPTPSYDLGNDTVSCGTSVTLDAGNGYNTYTWSTGSTTQTTTINSTDTVYVTVTDNNGCTMNDSIVVTLSPSPSVSLGADTTRCGGSVTLDAGNPGALYFWSNNTSSQTLTVNSSGTYYVDVVTQAGCTGSDTINVTINNQPDVNFGPDTSICQSTLTLDAGNPGSSYTWSNAATTQTITVGSGTYWVTATDPSGCSDSDTITVATNVPPVVTVSNDTSICAGGQATLTATGGVGYQWSTGATGQTITVSPNVNTSYYVTGTDINGCTASAVVIVNVLPGSNALFTVTVTGATAVFTNQSTNAVTYSWNFGDSSPADNSANPTHEYTSNGTYTVTLTITGPCGTDTYTQVVTITQVGLQDADLSNSLNVYPNPNNGDFVLAFGFSKKKDVQISVMDMSGRELYAEQANGISAYNKELHLNTAESGMYLIRIVTTDGVVVKKIVVEK